MAESGCKRIVTRTSSFGAKAGTGPEVQRTPGGDSWWRVPGYKRYHNPNVLVRRRTGAGVMTGTGVPGYRVIVTRTSSFGMGPELDLRDTIQLPLAFTFGVGIGAGPGVQRTLGGDSWWRAPGYSIDKYLIMSIARIGLIYCMGKTRYRNIHIDRHLTELKNENRNPNVLD